MWGAGGRCASGGLGRVAGMGLLLCVGYLAGPVSTIQSDCDMWEGVGGAVVYLEVQWGGGTRVHRCHGPKTGLALLHPEFPWLPIPHGLPSSLPGAYGGVWSGITQQVLRPLGGAAGERAGQRWGGSEPQHDCRASQPGREPMYHGHIFKTPPGSRWYWWPPRQAGAPWGAPSRCPGGRGDPPTSCRVPN